MAIPMLYLPFDGTLAGQDRAGVATATGGGAFRYVAVGRKNWMVNSRAALNTTGWTGVTRVQDPSFVTDDNPDGWCFEATSATVNVGGVRTGIDWPYGTGCTIGMDVKWISGQQDVWYLFVAHSGVGNSGGLYSLTAGNLDGAIHRITTQHANSDNFAVGSLNVVRGSGAPSGTSTIRFGNITVEEGATAGTWIPENYWLEHWGSVGTAHASPAVEGVAVEVWEGTVNLLPYGSMRAGTNGSASTNWSMQSGTATNRDWGRHRYLELDVTATGPSPLLYTAASGNAVVTPGNSYTASIWVYNPNASSRNVQVNWVWFDAGAANLGTSTSTTVAIPAGVAVVAQHTAVAVASSASARPQFNFAGASIGEKFFVREAQGEARTYASQPTPKFNGTGTLLSGHTYSGTAHQTTSTRAAASVTLDEAARISSLAGTILFRYRAMSTRGSDTELIHVGEAATGTDDELRVYYNRLSGNLIHRWTCGAIATPMNTAVANGDIEHTVRIDWNGTSFRTSLDGAAFQTGVRGTPTGDIAGTYNLFFGSYDTFQNEINGWIKNVLIFDRVLTDEEYTVANAMIQSDDFDWSALLPVFGGIMRTDGEQDVIGVLRVGGEEDIAGVSRV